MGQEEENAAPSPWRLGDSGGYSHEEKASLAGSSGKDGGLSSTKMSSCVLTSQWQAVSGWSEEKME